IDRARSLEDAGAAAIVMRSLFEEQIQSEAMATYRATESHADSFAEAQNYFADPAEFVVGPGEYLEHLQRIKKAVGIPVIASLNGFTPGGWLDYASWIEEAGADALELNVYYIPTQTAESSADIEFRTTEMVREVKRSLSIPVAVKLSPFYTALPHFAKKLEVAGADGLVLFNRFFEADIDIEELAVVSQMHLSDSRELLLRLRWLAILSGKLEKSALAVTGGVHTAIDAIKAIMCGASAVQLVASLLTRGPGHLRVLLADMVSWMEEKEYESLAQMCGSMNIARSPNPREYARGNYMHILQTWEGEGGAWGR
ncbi:MAG TPA: dihydroorotate dehydrogenase-like protein, partial [Thermoanaerobaculia bacterium]|nr:dihydroorotate dehydrogenase-like protein [Thermoanaerobaculia bacterium]